MYKKFVGALYAMNIVAQAAITLVMPAALMFFISWLLVEKCSAPTWIYAPLITVGVLAGFISMVKFTIEASEGLERLERAGKRKAKPKEDNSQDEKK